MKSEKTLVNLLNSENSKLEKTYTRKQTAELLHITTVTLWSYTKKGIINRIKVGSRVLYKESEILRVLAGN